MRIIIAGTRTSSEAQVRVALQRCPWIGFVTAVVSGTARGADQYAEDWAREHHLKIARFPADWTTHGKRAGPVRNKLMSENAEGLVAVWDGTSKGTRSMIQLAQRQGLRIAIYRTDLERMDHIAPTGQLADIWEFAEERAAMKEYAGGATRSQAEREAGVLAVQFLTRSLSSSV